MGRALLNGLLQAALRSHIVHTTHLGVPEGIPQATPPGPDREEGQEAALLTHSDLCQALLWELYTHHLVSLSCHPGSDVLFLATFADEQTEIWTRYCVGQTAAWI